MFAAETYVERRARLSASRAIRDPAVPRQRREPDELRRQHLSLPPGQHVPVLLRRRPARAGRAHRPRRGPDGRLRRRPDASTTSSGPGPQPTVAELAARGGRRARRAPAGGAGGAARRGAGRRRGRSTSCRRTAASTGSSSPALLGVPPRPSSGPPRSLIRAVVEMRVVKSDGGGRRDRAGRRHLGRHAPRRPCDGAPGHARERHRGQGHRDRAGRRRRPVASR